jgi:hypothetical protein
MKVSKIIDDLCSHEISKSEAIDMLTDIINGFRQNKSLEFVVEEIGFNINNDGILKIKIPYKYDEIKNRINQGDKIDVMILP